jgi:hypothetical protein
LFAFPRSSFRLFKKKQTVTMDKNRVSKRNVLAKKLAKILEDNVDLFEARYATLNQSSPSIEWFDEVKEVLVRFVVTSSALSDKELNDSLFSQGQLMLLVRDELQSFGVEDQAVDICRLLRGVIVAMNHDGEKKGGTCQDLVRWLYGGLQNSRSYESVACVDITEVEFKRMKEKSATGTDRLLTTLNAGCANSVLSEAFSFELLSTLLGGRIDLDKTEMEIEYKQSSKITDYSFRTLDEVRIGVSVTRACGKEFDAAEARRLLRKKLHGVNESTRSVASHDGWEKQVLHIWCENRTIADILKVIALFFV